MSSAGNTRGLIEGVRIARVHRKRSESSAGNTRGLIEGATRSAGGAGGGSSLPRGIPAASLKAGSSLFRRSGA